jgi:hypothetical protein
MGDRVVGPSHGRSDHRRIGLGYRAIPYLHIGASFGEHRTLREAPAQVVNAESVEDGQSIVVLNCLFLWDCWILSASVSRRISRCSASAEPRRKGRTLKETLLHMPAVGKDADFQRPEGRGDQRISGNPGSVSSPLTPFLRGDLRSLRHLRDLVTPRDARRASWRGRTLVCHARAPSSFPLPHPGSHAAAPSDRRRWNRADALLTPASLPSPSSGP